ncbi:hypothetical protein [Prosthecobacter sp.]|jgi:hypothetical protein|uniref:hypothetical protein n=1 Tax=Prosthecobacter sp. TaxID=1965333 RepID=UPI0037C80C03
MSEDDLALLESKLSDPIWRLTSGEIYKIKTADGRGIIPFIPRPEQVELLRELVDAVEAVKAKSDGWEKQTKKAKLKARRLGFSTTIGVFVADCLGFRANFTATLIDQIADDAKKKMNDIVKVALGALRECWPLKVLKENDSELTVNIDIGEEAGEDGKSTFYAGTRARGGSNDFLWCSELGVIQFDDPGRADEIVSGAFPSARHGVTVVETTWKGGRGGKLYDVIKPSIEGVAADWDVSFSPWWIDPRNVNEHAEHDAESRAYFGRIEERLEREGITLSDAQMRWYAAERRTQGIFMKRENPTFLDECWEAPIEGAIYAEALTRAETEGRILPRLPVADCVVDVFMDLGAPQNSPAWFCRRVGREIQVIDHDVGKLGETIATRYGRWLRKGHNLGTVFLPHDAAQTERTGRTIISDLKDAGVTAFKVVPVTHDIWTGINALLGLFPSLVFLGPQTEGGRSALSAYRTKEVKAGGIVSNEPVHDWASHHADALRTLAEAVTHGMWKVSMQVKDLDDWDKQRRKPQAKRAVMRVGG